MKNKQYDRNLKKKKKIVNLRQIVKEMFPTRLHVIKIPD